MTDYRALIAEALEYGLGTHSVDDVIAAVESGHMQFWPAANSCAITEIVQFPQKRVLNVFAAAGDMDEIIAAMEDVAVWAREQGCDTFAASGRPGWQRVLAKHGWQTAAVLMKRGL